VILSMIAQYRRRFGFTAVLISHDLPDVFFVSDRVVLLWQGTVGFEGTYEEAMRLSHPMIVEFLKSLEGLQDEMMGLLSKESFRSCYVSLFSEEALTPVTSAILYTVETDPLENGTGQKATAEVMEILGESMARHFRTLGGFSVRYANRGILTILPHTSIQEAEQLMVSYAGELKEQATRALKDAGKEGPVRLKGGVAEVSSKDDVDLIADKAASGQRVLAASAGESAGKER